MALQKTVTNDAGVSADYHRIEDLRFNYDDSVVRFNVEEYLDATARSGGKVPLNTTEYEVSGGDFTTYFAPAVLDVVNQNPQERAYEWLKTQTTPVDFTTGTTDV